MDKQAWIAVTLCVIGLIVWQIYYAPKYLPTPVPAHAAAAAASPATGTPAPGTSASRGEVVVDEKAAAPAVPTAEATTPEQIVTLTAPGLLELRFTNLGGGIAEAIPLGKQHLAEDGENIKLNHAGQTAIGAISAQPGDGTRLPYEVKRNGDTVVCERTEPNGLKISKEYSLDYQGNPKQIPAVRLKVTFANTGAQPIKDAAYYISAGSAAPIHRLDGPQYTCFDWMTGGNYVTTHATSFDASHVPGFGHEGREVIVTPVDKAAWVAVKNQFYATVVTPLDGAVNGQEPAAHEVWGRRFDLAPSAQDAAQGLLPLHGLEAALGLPGLSLPPGATETRTFQIYSGPKFYSRLDRLGHEEERLMDFGKFKIVSIFLLTLMNFFKSWLGNYGLAIILLTLIVKGTLFPLQNKANKSMKRMSALQPKMAELREKYKDDATKVNVETMKLYKQSWRQPAGRLLAHAHSDADLLRLPVHALHGGGTAQRTLPVGS